MPENPKKAHGLRKACPHFVPPVAILEEAKVMALGAEKYGAFNWRDLDIDATTYYSAAMRHLFAWYNGEDMDPESGVSHLAHVRACMAILLDAIEVGSFTDDRPESPRAKPGQLSHEVRERIRAAAIAAA